MKNKDAIVIRNSFFSRFRLTTVHWLRDFFKVRRFKGSRQIGKVCEFFAKNLLMPKALGPTVTPSLYGFDILVDPTLDNGLELLLFERGTYEAGTLYLMGKCLQSGDVFMDIGSNIGLMSLFASKAVTLKGKVHAFEPESRTYNILKQNIEINDFKNIFAHDYALGSSQSSGKIHSFSGNRGAASLLTDQEDQQEGIEVSIRSLDDFVKCDDISNVRMLKIDVEGWELEVLKGGSSLLASPDAPIICIECTDLHPTFGGQKSDIYGMIKKVNNYRIFKLKRGKERHSQLVEILNIEDLPSHDNLFCFLQEHIDQLDPAIFEKGSA